MPDRVPDLRRLHLERRGNALRLRREDGQAVVEFALLFPLLVVLLMGLIEFALAFNATLGINRASQDAALLASEAGNAAGTDCLILNSIETDITTPNDRRDIVQVQVMRTNPSGTAIFAQNIYSRTGSLSCTLTDGTTITVPYSATSIGYPESQRCTVLAGCPTMTPPRTQVDTVGVQIRYDHAWRTPLASVMNLIDGRGPRGTTFTFQKRNVFRMEPQL